MVAPFHGLHRDETEAAGEGRCNCGPGLSRGSRHASFGWRSQPQGTAEQKQRVERAEIDIKSSAARRQTALRCATGPADRHRIAARRPSCLRRSESTDPPRRECGLRLRARLGGTDSRHHCESPRSCSSRLSSSHSNAPLVFIDSTPLSRTPRNPFGASSLRLRACGFDARHAATAFTLLRSNRPGRAPVSVSSRRTITPFTSLAR